ncbi:hypothetical protein SteCoe_24999 [Stentor coeruleus]|uniref:Uncharacterized protein n=1 Tax=Stentor coeruleus TaxID=5963 RepID=A0A1R2BGL2_9CILI|nr:hypothetical protein SteCoe_24999 [Stentor coeruleus]
MGKYYKGNSQLSLVQILNKQVIQLDAQSYEMQNVLKNLNNRLEKLTRLLQNTKSQLKSLKTEILQAQEGIKDNKWQFSKDISIEILKIKNPNTTLVELAENFLLVLQLKDRSWHMFKSQIKNYDELKERIDKIQVENLSEEAFKSLESLWKNNKIIKSRLEKYCQGVKIIAEMLICIAEYKVKKETLDSSLEEFKGHKKKAFMTKSKIKEANAQILIIEEKISEVKITISAFDRSRIKDEDLDTSDRSSYTSPICSGKRSVSTNPFTNGTASGGILHHRKNTEIGHKPLIPGFKVKHDESYFESPKVHVQEDELHSVFNDNSISLGCCRPKFFCF